ILDPVGVGSSPLRRQGVASLLENLTFTAIRGNLAEIQFIVQGHGDLVGVEAGGDLDLPGRIALAQEGARTLRTIVAITGPWDVVASAEETFLVHNGHPLLRRVTGTGCMATSVMAAFLAVEGGALGAAAALAFYGLAGERAAQRAKGPGSLKAALFDELYNLAPEDAEECRVERRD
ncbi:MAG: hydroxyethylthiazole kinase, partial [Firmicutes bacterium]|nr:hydroxyethylthiazole kinase [Bacillota bacterium]